MSQGWHSQGDTGVGTAGSARHRGEAGVRPLVRAQPWLAPSPLLKAESHGGTERGCTQGTGLSP